MADLDKLFSKLKRESRTFAEAKKRRVKQTTHRLLTKKVLTQRRALIIGSLQRHHRTAHIVTQICGYCKGKQDIVESIQVWSQSPHDGVDATEITQTIRSHGMYEFSKDLPLVTYCSRTAIAICAKCLLEEYNAQSD